MNPQTLPQPTPSSFVQLRDRVDPRVWGALLLLGYALFAAKLELRHLHRPGHALAFFGVVLVTALLRFSHAARWERVGWGVLALAVLAIEAQVAVAYRVSERTFVYCHVEQNGRAEAIRVGPTGLRDVTMRVIDFDDLHGLHERKSDDVSEFALYMQTVQLGNFLEETQKSTSMEPLKTHGDLVRYRIGFTASNGSWWEDVMMRRKEGHWYQALRISRFEGPSPKVIYQTADAGFPSADNSAQWRWTSEL